LWPSLASAVYYAEQLDCLVWSGRGHAAAWQSDHTSLAITMPGAAMDMPEGKVMRPGPSLQLGQGHAAGAWSCSRARSCSSARSHILS